MNAPNDTKSSNHEVQIFLSHASKSFVSGADEVLGTIAEEARGIIEEKQLRADANKHILASIQRALDSVQRDAPPPAAEFVLGTLFRGRKGQDLLDSLDERFLADCRKIGARRARLHYWAATLHAIWPLLKRAIGRLVRWGIVADALRRFLGGA
jgi:hypothetical protein